jgi:hypothetical protein
MTAYEIANKWQLQYGDESLQERIDWHKEFGLVFITPKIFILASELNYNPLTKYLDMQTSNTNAWFIELAANATGESLFEHIKRILPNKKEWVLWLRRGSSKLHAYKWDEFARKAGV